LESAFSPDRLGVLSNIVLKRVPKSIRHQSSTTAKN
jgi:hypothetical protein